MIELGAVPRQERLAIVDRLMNVTFHGRARDPRAVEHRGMAEPVGQDEVVLAGQCPDHSKIREITAAEDQCALGPLELGEQPLQPGVKRMAARHEPRRTGAGAVPIQRLACCLDDLGMVSQSQIIVATEGNEFAASAAHPPAAEPFGGDDRAELRLVLIPSELVPCDLRAATAWVDILPGNASIVVLIVEL